MLQRIDLERVSAEASRIDIGRGLLTVLAGFFYVLGWALGRSVRIVATGVAWSIAAAKIGWQDGYKPSVRSARYVGAA